MSDELVEIRDVDDVDQAEISDIYIAGHPVGDLLVHVYREQRELEQRLDDLESQEDQR